jgi:hypothetical protein
MSPKKIFGVLVMAVVASTALIGTSSALAESTQLCENDAGTPAECKEPMEVHYVTPEGEPGVMETSVLTFKCDILYNAEVKLGLANPVILNVPSTGLVISNCTGGCTATTLAGAETKVLKEAAELASAISTGFEIEVKCTSIIKCVYGSEGLVAHMLGPLVTGDNGHVTYSKAAVKKVKGLLCPSSATMSMLLVALHPVYIKS